MRMAELDDNVPGTQTVKACFFPPLYLQRRAFILDIVKSEGVRSVVELGCGEGSILTALSQPAAHLDDVPTDLPNPEDAETVTAAEAYKRLRKVPLPPPQQRELHLSRLAGLDINRDALDQACRVTAPPDQLCPNGDDDIHGFGAPTCRWEKLKVELWQGSLDVHNDALDDYECFVASEVVEHLHPGPLSGFGRAVLGTYRPRLVIVTTPNYDFHPYFPRDPGSEEESKHRFPDPTGRTNRVFRDSDHKFEWTGTEFEQWCKSLASEYDYDVTFTGVGDLQYYRKDVALGDKKPLFATQCAVFRRIYAYAAERSPRSPRVAPLAFFSSKKPSTPTKEEHKLLKTHLYEARKCAGHPLEPDKLREALIELIQTIGFARINLRTLWGRTYLSKRCGGSVCNLLSAIVEDSSGLLEFEVLPDSHGIDAVDVIYKGSFEEEDEGPNDQYDSASDSDQSEHDRQ